jgi:hypothetical protein
MSSIFEVDGSKWDVEIDEKEEIVYLFPRTRRGEAASVARSDIPRDSYAYTHGGELYVAAVDEAKEIAASRGFEV